MSKTTDFGVYKPFKFTKEDKKVMSYAEIIYGVYFFYNVKFEILEVYAGQDHFRIFCKDKMIKGTFTLYHKNMSDDGYHPQTHGIDMNNRKKLSFALYYICQHSVGAPSSVNDYLKFMYDVRRHDIYKKILKYADECNNYGYEGV